jgi:hypothetical protein
MAVRKISLVWEGQLDDESLNLFMESPADCIEFIADSCDSKIIIEEDGVVVHEESMSDPVEEEIEGLADEKEPENGG